MFSDSWVRILQSFPPRTHSRRPRPVLTRKGATGRLSLEQLEHRLVPSAYTVTTTADSGPGSFRDAINQINCDHTGQYANAQGIDEIDFNISADTDTGGGFNATTGVATISPLSALPSVENTVFVNGYSQPGASCNTLLGVGKVGVAPGNSDLYGDNAVLKIVLNGENLGPAGYLIQGPEGVNGLELDGNNSTVQGLVVNSCPGFGIVVTGTNDTVLGNFVGTDFTGTQALGNTGGVAAEGVNDIVGGTRARGSQPYLRQ